MPLQDIAIFVLIEIIIYSLIISAQDWFFLKLIGITQLLTLLVLIVFYQTERTRRHVLRSQRNLSIYAIPMLLFSATGLYYLKPWNLTSSWLKAASLFSGEYGELALVTGLVLAVFIVIGSLALDGKTKW